MKHKEKADEWTKPLTNLRLSASGLRRRLLDADRGNL
jgi:hypothetical protein